VLLIELQLANRHYATAVGKYENACLAYLREPAQPREILAASLDIDIDRKLVDRLVKMIEKTNKFASVVLTVQDAACVHAVSRRGSARCLR
jgi:hypothetical protein